jgi:hypothetical protein
MEKHKLLIYAWKVSEFHLDTVSMSIEFCESM